MLTLLFFIAHAPIRVSEINIELLADDKGNLQWISPTGNSGCVLELFVTLRETNNSE